MLFTHIRTSISFTTSSTHSIHILGLALVIGGHDALIAVNHVDATDEPLYRKFLPCGFMAVEREGIAR